MLVEVKGDLLKTYKGVGPLIVVPVNKVGVAGRGLALWMRMRFQEAYERYEKHCRRGNIALGELKVYDAVTYKLAFFPTKHYWNNDSDPALIRQSVRRLFEYMEDNDIREAHAPQFGCGQHTGRLDWYRDVRPIVEEYFTSGCGYTLHVYSR